MKPREFALLPFVLLLPVMALMVVVVGGAVFLMSYDRSPGFEVLERDDTAGEPVQARTPGDVCHTSRPGAGQPVFNPEYTQKRQVLGITIVGNAAVDSKAFDKAEETITTMFANNSLDAVLADLDAYIVIADSSQGVLDLPEFACLEGEIGDTFFENVCGVADRADYPVATVNEDDLLGRRSGPCRGLNILYHELGHLVQGWALDPADYFDVKLYYQAALNEGKYRRAYAATNTNEYFAEGTQAYFLSLETNGSKDREWLKRYDRNLYDLLERVYGE